MNNIAELGFFDLLQILFKRKWLFMAIVVGVLILGAIFSVVMPKRYQYSQVVELATYGDWGQPELINTSDYIVTRLENIYIPEVVEKYHGFSVEAADEKGDKGLIKLTVTGPGGSLSVVQNILAAILVKVQDFERPAFEMHKRLQQTNLEKVEHDVKLRNRVKQAIAEAAEGKLSSSQITGLQVSSMLLNEAAVNAPGDFVRQKANYLYFMSSHFAFDKILAHPSGFSKKLIMLLFFVMAFLIGLLAVLFAEFLANMREVRKV